MRLRAKVGAKYQRRSDNPSYSTCARPSQPLRNTTTSRSPSALRAFGRRATASALRLIVLFVLRPPRVGRLGQGQRRHPGERTDTYHRRSRPFLGKNRHGGECKGGLSDPSHHITPDGTDAPTRGRDRELRPPTGPLSFRDRVRAGTAAAHALSLVDPWAPPCSGSSPPDAGTARTPPRDI